MSFGSKSSTPSTPQPTFTPQAGSTEPIKRGATSAEAQDRTASASDPQAALLQTNTSNASDEERKRLMDGSSVSGMY